MNGTRSATIIVPGIFAGALLAVAEIALVGYASTSYCVYLLLLSAGFGVFLSAALLCCETIASRTKPVVRILGADGFLHLLVAFCFVGLPVLFAAATLFDGPRASHLPLARFLPLILPLLATAVAWLGLEAYSSPWMASRKWVAAAIVLASVIAIEWVSRRTLVGQYVRVHLLSVYSALLALYTFLRICLGSTLRAQPLATRAARLTTVAALLAMVPFFVTPAVFGFRSLADRWFLALHPGHARLLLRELRSATDFDGDGFGRFFGGGDCNDASSEISPAALDLPDNEIDEDCDGQDTAFASQQRPGADAYAALHAWSQTKASQELHNRLASRPLVIISVDTLRADAVRSEKVATPALDELRAESSVFTRAYAPASGTDVSLWTLMTGLADPFQSVHQTLFEALSASGRYVHVVTTGNVLRWVGRSLLLRGVNSHDSIETGGTDPHVIDRITSGEITSAALAAIDAHATSRPFALWVHYFAPHEHYRLEPPANAVSSVDREGSSTATRYLAFVAKIDQEIGKLLSGLRRRGLADATLVFLSDHGEALGEDARYPPNHGYFVYEPLVRIPMAIRIAGMTPREIDTPVSMIDLSATLFAIAQAGPEMHPQIHKGVARGGKNLMALIAGVPGLADSYRGPILLTELFQSGVIEWPYKFMVRPADNLQELYELESDPSESNNLAAQLPALVAQLKATMASLPRIKIDRSEEGRAWRERLGSAP